MPRAPGVVTRWHVINLPVYVGARREPLGAVRGVWPDWEAGRVDRLTLDAGPWSVPAIQFTHEVHIDVDGVRLNHVGQVERQSGSWLTALEAGDWQGRLVVDGTGRLVGRVTDLEFQAAGGGLVGIWVSRGILADLWHGMLLADMRSVVPERDRIVVGASGKAGA